MGLWNGSGIAPCRGYGADSGARIPRPKECPDGRSASSQRAVESIYLRGKSVLLSTSCRPIYPQPRTLTSPLRTRAYASTHI